LTLLIPYIVTLVRRDHEFAALKLRYKLECGLRHNAEADTRSHDV
jgi:hypothetical protein